MPIVRHRSKGTYFDRMRQARHDIILGALIRSNWVTRRAAKDLSMTEGGLYLAANKAGISIREMRSRVVEAGGKDG